MDEKRNLQIYNYRLSGMKFSEIAVMFCISEQRARQIYFKEKWKNEEKTNLEIWYSGLSARTRNCLLNAGVEGREDAEYAITTGKLKYKGSMKTKNYGWKSHVELCKWLGLPEPIKNKKVCPHCGGLL